MKPVVALPLIALLVPASGCSETPAEPAARTTATGRAAGQGDAAVPSATASADAPARRSLEWELPPGWVVERTAEQGSYRLKAQVPPVGNDKAPANLLARALGRSDRVDVEAEIAAFFREFDGDVGARARRDEVAAVAMSVRVVEVTGDYQQPVGPPMGPRGKHAAYVMQRGWRGIAALTTTPHREVWLFRLVGPSDTVESARSGMHALLRSLREAGTATEPASPAPPAPNASSNTVSP